MTPLLTEILTTLNCFLLCNTLAKDLIYMFFFTYIINLIYDNRPDEDDVTQC